MRVWGLIALNVGLWLWGWPGPITGSIDETLQQITTIERELPEREKLAAWCNKAQEGIKNPPEADPGAFLQRVRTIGESAGFKLGESTIKPGSPSTIRVSGSGSWRAIQGIINETGREPAVIIDRLALTLRDDALIELLFEARVRSGPWEGDAGKVGVEPAPESASLPVLSGIDPFAIPSAPPPPAPVSRPIIRYLGYFSEGGTATVIMETQGKSQLLQVGETPAKGIRISSASPDLLGLIDERGSPWTVPMEKHTGQR